MKRTVLQTEEKESSLGASCSERLSIHANSSWVPWVKLRLCVCFLSGKLKRAAGVIVSQSSPQRFGSYHWQVGSHGMDEVTYKECTEKKESRAESLAISHVSV